MTIFSEVSTSTAQTANFVITQLEREQRSGDERATPTTYMVS